MVAVVHELRQKKSVEHRTAEVAPQMRSPEHTRDAVAAMGGIGCRILVVDDDPDGADSLAALLTLIGHDTVVANDGLAALVLADTFRPDVVVLDLGMPGIDGFEVAERLRRTPMGPGLLLIAATGWGHPEDRRRSLAAGFDHHLAKPVDLHQLAEIIASKPQP